MAGNNKRIRRRFLRQIALGTGALNLSSIIEGMPGGITREFLSRSYGAKNYSVNDQINLATIGFGIRGIDDSETVVEVPEVRLVAVCDLYTGRLERSNELYGRKIRTTRD